MGFCDDPRRLAPIVLPKVSRFKKRHRDKVMIHCPACHSKGKLKDMIFHCPRCGKWHKCEQLSWDVPVRHTGEPLGLDVGGFRFDDSDAGRWELAPVEIPVIPLSKVLRKFYVEARWWRKPKAWARDPESKGSLVFQNFNAIIVLYGGNYSITIEREGMFGPHPARLFYRSMHNPNEIAWVGIVQLHGLWHSDERLLNALNAEIRSRRFYQSEETSRILVLQ